MKPNHIRTGVRLIAWGAASYAALSVAYVACVVAACW